MNTDLQAYIDIARAEILHLAFGVTEQYLEVNELVWEDGLPKVERVDLEYNDRLVAVYFPFEGEEFFLEVHLTKAPRIAVDFVYTQSGHSISLTATSEEWSYEALCSFLPFRPLRGWSKGDVQPNGKSVYKFSRVIFEPISSKVYELERKLMLLLTELERDVESVQCLATFASTYISILRHQYVEGKMVIQLEEDMLKRLSALNISVEIATYLVGNPFKD